MNTFAQNITQQIAQKKSHICVGLDTDYAKIPDIVKKNKSVEDAIFDFNKAIIDETQAYAIAYKPNFVFYGAYGIEGLKALMRTTHYIKDTYPECMVIAEAKRSEMLITAQMVGKEIFEKYRCDAMTATPWFGQDTVEMYAPYTDKAIFIFCHDSNPSAGELQDLTLASGELLYEHLTELVVNRWNKNGNVLVEAPLTYPTILKRIYELCDDRQFLLIAGLGPQGGKVDDLKLLKKQNFVVNASRAIIAASTGDDFAQAAGQAAKKYRDEINKLFC